MADDLTGALLDLLRTAQLDQEADFLRDGMCALTHAVMDVEVTV